MAPLEGNGSGAGGGAQAMGLRVLYVEDDARAAAEIIQLAEASGDTVIWEDTGSAGLLRAGMEGQITMPALNYTFSTTGGMADADASTTALGLSTTNPGFFSFGIPGNDGSGNCGSNACLFQVSGNFTGANTDTVGINYTAGRPTFSTGIGGAAIFAAGPERGAPTAAAGNDWSRFAGSEPGPTGVPAAVLAPAAVSAAEVSALLGGAIKFGE